MKVRPTKTVGFCQLWTHVLPTQVFVQRRTKYVEARKWTLVKVLITIAYFSILPLVNCRVQQVGILIRHTRLGISSVLKVPNGIEMTGQCVVISLLREAFVRVTDRLWFTASFFSCFVFLFMSSKLKLDKKETMLKYQWVVSSLYGFGQWYLMLVAQYFLSALSVLQLVCAYIFDIFVG